MMRPFRFFPILATVVIPDGTVVLFWEFFAQAFHETLKVMLVQRDRWVRFCSIEWACFPERQGYKAILIVKRGFVYTPYSPLARFFQAAADTTAARKRNDCGLLSLPVVNLAPFEDFDDSFSGIDADTAVNSGKWVIARHRALETNSAAHRPRRRHRIDDVRAVSRDRERPLIAADVRNTTTRFMRMSASNVHRASF